VADTPNVVNNQAPRMTLVDYVREQEAIGHDSFPGRKRRLDHFLNQLRAGRHVEEHFTAARNRRGSFAREQNFANPLAKLRGSRVTTDDDLVAVRAQPFAEQL
jgi:hypothetical protein